jgi:alpha-ribazole phosphatase
LNKSIYLIRHTEPVLPDDEPRFLGQSDQPLSTFGHEHAYLLAERLGHVPFDAVYSSDLKRCLMTAEILAAARGIGVRVDERFREIDTGLWSGLSFKEARKLYPREYAERERDLVGCRFPGGESFRDVRDRVVPAFMEIVDGVEECVLVCSHKGTNRVLLSEFQGLPPAGLFSIQQEYGCVYLIKAVQTPSGKPYIEAITPPTWES